MSHEFDDHVVDLEQLDSTKSFGRRSFLVGALATGAAVSAPINYAAIAKKRRVPIAKNGKFNLGVASGFPRPNGIVLWTELSEITRTSKLRVAVATDPKFKNTVYEKDVVARADRGFTTRVFVRKLKPRKEYYYRFFTKNQKSEVGPLPHRSSVRLGGARSGSPTSPARTTRPASSTPSRRSPSRTTSTSSSASATTCTSTPTPRPELGGRAQGHTGPQRRRRRPVPRRVLPEVPPLQVRSQPEGDARRAPVHLGLGRPRGRGQPRRRLPELRPEGPEQDQPEGLPAPRARTSRGA